MMTISKEPLLQAMSFIEPQKAAEQRYVRYFHELDAWTEFWDIYHPETKGRYYFGDDMKEPGLLRSFLPRDERPAAFEAWTKMALLIGNLNSFKKEIRVPKVFEAILEIDNLLGQIFNNHFKNAADSAVQADYLNAMYQFAIDTLPPAIERDQRIAEDDPRKPTAGTHTLVGDIMWFAWALQIEAAHILVGKDKDHARRALMLAGVVVGCAANFAWLGHRRTRPEYKADEATRTFLLEKGIHWASNFKDARKEVHALYRIREWGEDD